MEHLQLPESVFYPRSPNPIKNDNSQNENSQNENEEEEKQKRPRGAPSKTIRYMSRIKKEEATTKKPVQRVLFPTESDDETVDYVPLKKRQKGHQNQVIDLNEINIKNENKNQNDNKNQNEPPPSPSYASPPSPSYSPSSPN